MNITALNDIISASVRIATPITLAALGGVFCQKAAIRTSSRISPSSWCW